jgi:hypothetical protein
MQFILKLLYKHSQQISNEHSENGDLLFPFCITPSLMSLQEPEQFWDLEQLFWVSFLTKRLWITSETSSMGDVEYCILINTHRLSVGEPQHTGQFFGFGSPICKYLPVRFWITCR